MSVKAPYRVSLGDKLADQAMEDHRRVIQDMLRSIPSVIKNVTLVDGSRTVVQHGLGRKYTSVFVSPVRGDSLTTGFISEEAASNKDREIWLTADGFGAEVTVDLLVYT